MTPPPPPRPKPEKPAPPPGRNDPCHCGSGKKYKKCCKPRDDELRFDPRRRDNPKPDPRLLFVFPGKMGDALFALPTLLSCRAIARQKGIRRITWVMKPYTLPIAEVIRAGLGDRARGLEFMPLDGNPSIPPSRAGGAGKDVPTPPMGHDWQDWSAEDWMRAIPGHSACVNASMQGAPRGDTHLTHHIAQCAGIEPWPERVTFDREAISALDPRAGGPQVIYQPTCSEPEKTPIDLVYCRLPAGTVVVRERSDPGIPRQMFWPHAGVDEVVGAPLRTIAAAIARARLVIGVSSLIPVLGAMMGVPSIMVHQITTPEQCGITPWGGHDVMNPRNQRALEELVERILHAEPSRRSDARVPVLQ